MNDRREKITGIVTQIYKLNGGYTPEAVTITVRNLIYKPSLQRREAEINLAKYFLEHPSASSHELCDVIEIPVAHLSSLSPCNRGLIDLDQTRGRIYHAVVSEDVLRTYINLMEELMRTVSGSNES